MHSEDTRKQIVARAIVDPEFRMKLYAEPEAVFQTKKLSKQDTLALARMRKMLPAMDDLVSSLAGEILCGGGGGCGGLA